MSKIVATILKKKHYDTAMKKDFYKNLEELNFPEIETPGHKAKLKLALIKSSHFKRSFSWFSNLLYNLKNMSLLTKSFSIGLIIVLAVAIVFTKNNFSGVQVVDAKAVVAQAIKKLSNQTNPDVSAKIDLLQKAKDASSLKYLGEEKLEGKQYQKLAFDDQQSGQIIFYINPKDNSTDSVIILFAKTKKNVYLLDQPINGADPASIRALNEAYLRDKNAIYYYDQKIKGADVDSFEALTPIFAKDNYAVYRGAEKIIGADSASFIILNKNQKGGKPIYYGKDKNHLFNDAGEIMKDADRDSFQILSEYYYSKDRKNVYFMGDKLQERDPATFEILGARHSKDKNGIYIDNEKLEDVDKNSFRYLGNNYAKDKNFAYCLKEKIVDADVHSFTTMHSPWYARDKNNIYACNTKLEGIDADSFQIMEGTHYFKDKNGIYTGLSVERVEGADPATFKPFSYDYASDKYAVYFINQKIEGIDMKTFQILGGTYFKDKSKVYNPEIIKGADPASFQILNEEEYYSKDKNAVYRFGEKIPGADPVTFQTLGHQYAKDKNGVYYLQEKLAGADPTTFKVFKEAAYAQDKNGIYYAGTKLN
jgi:hypothetical protein